jgi:hypothetical protein
MRLLLHKRMTRVWAISGKEYRKVIERLLISMRMQKESHGSRIGWLYQRKKL